MYGTCLICCICRSVLCVCGMSVLKREGAERKIEEKYDEQKKNLFKFREEVLNAYVKTKKIDTLRYKGGVIWANMTSCEKKIRGLLQK